MTLCEAKTKKGTPCQRGAGYGTKHLGQGRCKFHGGATPNAEVAGQVFLARREAMVMGVPLDIDPLNAILECIRIAAGEVQYASDRIAELDEDEAVGPVTVTTTRPLKEEKGAESESTTVQEVRLEAPQLHVWILARRQAMDRLAQYSLAALKAGIEERRVRLAEDQGRQIVEVLKGVLAELGVADRPEVPAVVRRHLTLIAGAA